MTDRSLSVSSVSWPLMMMLLEWPRCVREIRQGDAGTSHLPLYHHRRFCSDKIVGKFALLTAVLDNYIIGLCSSLVAILMIFTLFWDTAHNFWLWLLRIPIIATSAQFFWEQTRRCLSPLPLSCWLDTSWSPNQWHYKHQTLFCCLSWPFPNITLALSHLWCVVQHFWCAMGRVL